MEQKDRQTYIYQQHQNIYKEKHAFTCTLWSVQFLKVGKSSWAFVACIILVLVVLVADGVLDVLIVRLWLVFKITCSVDVDSWCSKTWSWSSYWTLFLGFLLLLGRGFNKLLLEVLVLLLGLLCSTATSTVIASIDGDSTSGFFTNIVGGFCAFAFYKGREIS